MPLILAIDPDKRQSTQLASLVKTQLQAELVQRATAGEALEALQGRVPDLVLTTSLISLREDAVLATYLRELGAAAAHVQTVTIPLLGTVAPQRARGMLAALRREKPQPAMTDGCAPDVFADQIRQYLSTADEQKAAAAAAPVTHASIEATETYEVSPFETIDTPEPELVVEPVVEPAFVEPAVVETLFVEPLVSVEAPTDHIADDDFEPAALGDPAIEFEPLLAGDAPAHVEAALVLDRVEDQAVAEATIEPAGIESEFDAWAASAPAPHAAVEAIALADAVETEADADALVADEPAGLPLSQLLQLVSDWTSAAVAAPPQPESAFEEFDEAFIEEPAVEESLVEEPVVEAQAVEEALVVDAVSDDVEDALVEQALVEEAVAAAAPGTPLDPADWADEELAAVADELEAVSAQPNAFAEVSIDPVAAQALDELSRQVPVASAGDGIPLEPPVPVVEMRSFQSLDSIANELAAAPPPKYDNLNDIASLFAASPSPGRSAKSGFESLFATPSAPAPLAPIEVPGIDPSLFAAPVARRTAPEPSSSFESLFAAPPQVERDVFAVPSALEPALTELEEAPAGEFFIEPVVEPVALEPVAAAPVFDETAYDEPIAAAPVFAAPVAEMDTVEETIDFEAELAALAAVAPAVEVIEPVAAVIAAPAPVAHAVAAADALDEEIALDIDAFEAPKVETRFSFTLVDGFGDAWSDFEVPSAEAAAADFGLSAQPPMDPYSTATEPVSAPELGETEAPSSGLAAPVLDDEALSIIGDAARKASLDALVIEEFERGSRRSARKPKAKKVHAGATHAAAAAPDRTAKKKGPVQDEWGLFDPEQCGFAALEDEESGERRPVRDGSTRVRVISY